MERARALSAAPASGPAASGFGHLGAVTTDAIRRMPNHDDINAWVRAVAEAADRPAFAALFRYFAPRIKGYLLRGGTAEALAEELAQETMVVLWRRAASFDPSRAQLSTWLFTIARNLRIDHQRRAVEAVADAPDDWDAEQQPADAHMRPDELLLASERERGVRQALAALPPEQAQVLWMSFFEEHPHGRIAQDLGIPLGTVKSRIRLAVTQLRRILERYQP